MPLIDCSQNDPKASEDAQRLYSIIVHAHIQNHVSR